MAGWFEWQGDTLWLRLRLQPRARQTAFVGPVDDVLKVQIKAPPVEGKANAELISFLAKAFGVTKKAVTIERGEKSKAKRVSIQNPSKSPEGLQMLQ